MIPYVSSPAHGRVHPSATRWLAALFLLLSTGRPAIAATVRPDSLTFAPADEDSISSPIDRGSGDTDDLPRAPFGEHLITDPETWRIRGESDNRAYMVADYNRVDRIRFGVGYELQQPEKFTPRVGARLEYAFQRDRFLYGAQFEQPLVDAERFAVGVSVLRRTDHNELEQVPDLENSLALLFARQDYRDYYERDGVGGYVAVRLPAITTFSMHARNDRYRTLELDRGTRSFFQRDRALRDNPAIEPGEAHTLSWRLDHRAHPRRLRGGFYHWIDLERAGHGLGGDFRYTRLLGDLRSVLRLSPATTLAVRLVVGHALDGKLPFQRSFLAGGVDGLRAHAFATYRGDQMLLGQTEYTAGLWKLRSRFFEGGLHAIAFIDAGRAWDGAGHRWDIGRQHVAADGGFGIGTSEDNLRVYLARSLRDSGSDFVVSVRLQRPF